MLASDLIVDIRASRTISADQVEHLERLVFAKGAPSSEHLDLLAQIDTYVDRAGPHWRALLARAAPDTAEAEGVLTKAA